MKRRKKWKARKSQAGYKSSLAYALSPLTKEETKCAREYTISL